MKTITSRALLAVALLTTFAWGQQPQTEPTLSDFSARFEARSGNDLALSLEFVNALRDDSGMASAVPALLRGGGVSTDASRTMLHSLERAGTSAAQRALVTVFSDPAQRHLDRLRAVVAAGGVAAPTKETLDGLWGAANQRHDPQAVDVANTALLAIGVVGSTYRDLQPKSYPAVRDSLVGSLGMAADPIERSMLLKALGNLHDPVVGFDANVYLFDSSATVRASAADALGFMGAEDSRDLMLSVLVDEPRGVVRAALVEGLSSLTADAGALGIVHEVILDEAHPGARAHMAAYLGEHLDLIPEARETLEAMMRTDPSNRIRILAASTLSHPPVGG